MTSERELKEAAEWFAKSQTVEGLASEEAGKAVARRTVRDFKPSDAQQIPLTPKAKQTVQDILDKEKQIPGSTDGLVEKYKAAKKAEEVKGRGR